MAKRNRKHSPWGALIVEGALNVIFSSAVAILGAFYLSKWIYPLYAHVMNLAGEVGLTPSQLQLAYQTIVNYLMNATAEQLVIPYFSSSEQGLIHFNEVRHILIGAYIVMVIALIGVGYFYTKPRLKRYYQQLGQFLKWACYLPILLLFAAVIGFDQLFLVFHRVLFVNDYWLFDPARDPIINVLPESFFLLMFIVMVILYECLLLLMAFLHQRR